MNEEPTSFPPLIEVRDLSLRYENKQLVRNFSMRVAEGEKVVLTGESGTGKTTFLHAILGFLRPESGAIFVDGEEINEKTAWHVRQKIGFVPQEPDLGSGMVIEILRRPFGFKANRHLFFDRARVQQMFDTFRLEESLLEKDIGQLSGGEKQRVALISALLLDRRIYLFDEVTSALDDNNKDAVINYCGVRGDITILMVTHDSRLRKNCHRVYSLDHPQWEGNRS
jgi:ABC-type multidrug transport system ATPase subunit